MDRLCVNETVVKEYWYCKKQDFKACRCMQSNTIPVQTKGIWRQPSLTQQQTRNGRPNKHRTHNASSWPILTLHEMLFLYLSRAICSVLPSQSVRAKWGVVRQFRTPDTYFDRFASRKPVPEPQRFPPFPPQGSVLQMPCRRSTYGRIRPFRTFWI